MFKDGDSIQSLAFCKLLKVHGFDFFAAVPCSYLEKLIDALIKNERIAYVSATREDEAIGIAAGAYLGGKKPVVLMQNSGLSNSVGTLASLVLLYRIPMLLLVSWRGYEGKDAPEHRIVGQIVPGLLGAIKIPMLTIGESNSEEETVSKAIKLMNELQSPVAIMIKEGTFK